jgi:hypothetical protein
VEFEPYALAAALEGSPLGAAMRGSRGLYPAADIVHLLGLVLLVGGIGLVDLRIAGLGRAIPLAPLSRLLTPFAVAGLALLAVSGIALFAADAGPLVRSRTFLLKMGLMALGLLNAFVFRRRFGDFEDGREPPALARLLSGASLGIWLAVGALGRLIAFT